MRLMSFPKSLPDMADTRTIHSGRELTDLYPCPHGPARTLHIENLREWLFLFLNCSATDVGLELLSLSAEIWQATTWVVIDTAKVDCLVQKGLLSVCVGCRRNILNSAYYGVKGPGKYCCVRYRKKPSSLQASFAYLLVWFF